MSLGLLKELGGFLRSSCRLLSIGDLASNPATPGPEEVEKVDKFVEALDLRPYFMDTGVPRLLMIKAGARLDEDAYAGRVSNFDWEAFYGRFPWLFRALANRLAAEFDYVLIDSRTGLTDSSGICSMLLPSKLVVAFTPGRQSLLGASGLVRRAIRYRRLSSDSRPLSVFPLPSRIDNSLEDLKALWRTASAHPDVGDGYQTVFEAVLRDSYGLEHCSLQSYFDSVAIQHVPDFAYGERLAVEGGASEDRQSLSASYGDVLPELSSVSI